MFKRYYYLTKPGIIYGNSLSVIAGFFLASKGLFHPLLFLATLVGIGLVMASGCVFNNYIDRDIDEKMERTKKRALVTNKISVKNALIFGTVLGIVGFGLLLYFTNVLTAFVAFIGFFFYVIVYTFSKRTTVHSTLLGSISGAVPPVVGYVAVTNHFDIGALLLFLVLVTWQMPHFYAISIFRYADYAAAAIPVLSVKKGMKETKIQMLLYILAFLFVCILFTVFRLTGYLSLIAMLLLGIWWLLLSVKGFKATDEKKWARKLFGASLLVLLVLCLVLSVDVYLPF